MTGPAVPGRHDEPAVVPAHVEAGGPALHWRRGDLQLSKMSVSSQDNNAYLLTDAVSGDQLLIDAADDAPRLLELLHACHPHGRLTAVVTTHRHWDHHRALTEVVAATGADVLAGAPDAGELPTRATRRLVHQDVVDLGSHRFEVIALRGHTRGSIALAWRDPQGVTWLFTGDSLFPGGVGKTRSQEDFEQLLADVTARVFDMHPDSTLVHPGHGDSTILGTQRPQLPAWRERGW
ncbi:MBL fold metallo-hydrolase [Ruania suaedae]|uniref:MBL fold metallo-hydrolase n=1 Tax=Ruania suaedae TaxID=2897774 RepID=UPI001E535F29|nr:MBL fold metallo-hydrolase [Ruania suaedae]UFU04429.1 MBL fold metallo-hydrolase [Ruania suaedae]